jgi:alcohol/geraniol dehydrogenase (NADP+)
MSTIPISTIPSSTIHGYAVHAAGAELLPFKYEASELAPHDVEVRVTHCGICRSDLHLIDNDGGLSKYPFIPGHEIIGTVNSVGSEVTDLAEGDRVGIGWQADSCGHCEWCRKGEEHLCAQSQPTCVHRHGGYAESIRVNARFALKIPDALESDSTAPLLCAGIAVYHPLRLHGVNPSSRVGVIGIGGLGHIALQFARTFGADVTAFSSTAAKEADALALGAHHFVHTRESKGLKRLAGSFDLILSTINADQDWQAYLTALRPHGTLCFAGVPSSPVATPASSLTGTMKTMSGCNTGSPVQIAEMLDVAARHNVKAQVERFPMAKANDAVKRVRKNQVRYRAVLTT